MTQGVCGSEECVAVRSVWQREMCGVQGAWSARGVECVECKGRGVRGVHGVWSARGVDSC